MSSKIKTLAQLAADTTSRLTGSFTEWTAFLQTAARLYKYPYNEQLLIHAQRPDATACADFDVWNKRMGRAVRRGSRGIAILDTSRGAPQVRYVFDIGDTVERPNAKHPYLWELTEENQEAVAEALSDHHDVSADIGLAWQLDSIARQLAEERWQENQADILTSVADSFLEELDEDNIQVSFCDACAASTLYVLLARCGLDTDGQLQHEDFLSVFDFNTPAAAAALGTAVSQNSEKVLRQIEVTIKNFEQERRKEYGRDTVQTRGGLSAPGAGDGASPVAGQVRPAAAGVSEGESADIVQPAAPGGDTQPTFDGDRQVSSPAAGASDTAASEGNGDNRGLESPRPHEVGGPDEQREASSGGNNSDGAGVQLEDDSGQFSLFGAGDFKPLVSAPRPGGEVITLRPQVPQAAIDEALRIGANDPSSRLRIVAEFMKDKPVEENARFLQHHYKENGAGFYAGERKYALWYNDTGMRISPGESVNERFAATIPWEQAAGRIRELLDAGEYAGQVTMYRAWPFEKKRVAEALQFLHRDMNEEYKNLYLPTLTAALGNRYIYPDVVEKTKALLEQPEQLESVIGEFTDFLKDYAHNRGILRFHNHRTDEILQGLKDLQLEPMKFTAAEDFIPQRRLFISQDEIDKLLREGPDHHDYRLGIVRYFEQHPDKKEREKYLSHLHGEYQGDSGGNDNIVYTYKQLEFSHGSVTEPYAKVELKWNKVRVRIEELIAKGTFLSDEDKEILESRYLEADTGQEVETSLETAQRKMPYQVVVYHHIENGFDEKLDYQTLAEAEKAAQGYIDGTMEEDGFQYEGAGIYDLVEEKWLRVFGDFPHEKALEQIRQAHLLTDNAPPAQMKMGAADAQELVASEPPLPAVEQPKPTSTIEAIYPADKNNLPYEIIIEKLHIPEQEKPAPAPNFRITDENLGVGGAKAHYKMNVDAIKLLRQLQAEGRQATPEEQGILSKYVGWGGLSDAFDEAKPTWASEYKELRELLSPEEYASARGSTLNAHYTIPVVIRAMYQALENMGFKGGNILEPSMGVGNFFGCLPDSMRNSKLYGVELDTITGQIAKQLYPQADITIAGFETTDRHNFYDAAIGNVPFGNYHVHDPAYNRLGFSIHNYFFAKALDQVRPGGIVAFLTSRYTMDSRDTKVRKYLAERADLLGAIRLPNSTFRANAGTEVIEDILFLQKRETPAVETPSWVQTGETPLGFRINQYFLDNPHMVLGTEKGVSSQYGGQEYSVEPLPDADLGQQLAAAITHIHGQYVEAEPPDLDQENGKPAGDVLPADPDVKNFSYTIKNGDVYYRQNSIMVKQALNGRTAERIKGLIGLRDCVQKLIGQQLDGFVSEESIRKTQAELNALYDDFSKEFGLVNDRGNRIAFSQDSGYYLLCALEVLDDEGHFLRKADMFSKRTIQPHIEINHVNTATEALAVSIGERAKVDLPYMAQLTGKAEEEIITELRGQIFRVPLREPPHYVTADEYLSGNVREKLAAAQAVVVTKPEYQINVDALTAAQPKDLDASEIDVRLGATWVDAEYYEQFMLELLETPRNCREYIHVSHSDVAEVWNISGKSSIPLTDIPAYTTYGTGRANAYRLLEDALNLRTTRIFDTVEDADGREKRVLNSKETMLAQEKQQMIKLAFQDWIFRDPDRRQTLVRKYNDEMNSIRPREYNGDYLVLAGMNPAITLEKHQKDAIARAVYGGNTLFAHCVGAGKTFEMTASAMEMKRLGLCHKSMIVVPNHLTQQWACEFLSLYPNANILVTTKRDFETGRRKKFCARIATGDYDAVIIGCSQFEKIPISTERQQALLEREIDEIADGIASIKEGDGERFTIKAMERTRKGLEARLEKLQANVRKDTVITFEELGVDRLFVDESDAYKNLFFVTKMNNVAGLSATESQRASDMFMKTRYLDELTGSKGVIFATGTPISNSIAEMYTVQRYLQYETLQRMGMAHFDSWASRFGETVTSMELAPEGTGYRQRTRFAKFHNLPELMNIFHEVADIKTADQLNLPTPEAVYHNEVAKPTEFQLAYLQKLSERATKIHNREVDSNEDNMLVITNDGRKLGLDQRLIEPASGDAPGSKLNMCVDNIVKIRQNGAEKRLTQMVFCDSSTPKKGGGFNVYDDIKAKLIARGIPENEIAFIHDANSDTQKKALFAKVRSGTVRVLLGSTEKMGAGTNAQDRLIALHNLDCPWRPRDLTQREGRIKRRGNQNPTVHIYRYVTENTFDSFLWQTVQKKQEFIGQIMTSKSPVRSCEDIDSTAMDFAEVKALCAGDPRIKERMELDIDVSRLKILQASHRSQQYRLEDRIRLSLPKEQSDTEWRIQCLQEDIATVEAHPQPAEGFVGMEVCGKTYSERKAAGIALLEVAASFEVGSAEKIGQYRGFSLCIRRRDFFSPKEFLLRGRLTYVVEAGDSDMGNVTKIENALARLPAELEKSKLQLDNIEQQFVSARAELGKPFPQEQELKDKIARMAELDRVLQLEEKGGQEQARQSSRQSEQERVEIAL